MRNASSIDVDLSRTSSSRSFGITINVSHASRSSSTPTSACRIRRLPSNRNGVVTMPTVSAPSSRAIRATTGAAPEPVPPPSPAATKTMSEPRRTRLIWSYASSAARRPTAGSAPEPRPSVSSLPMWSFTGASLICSCWMSVLTAMNSTCVIPASIIRSSAFRPAPPTPTTRITARYEAGSRPRSRRAGLSGIGSSQRVTGRSASRTSRGGLSAAGSGAGAGAGRCFRSGAGSSGWSPRRAASVARKRSASGPSRMLARFLATEHLLRQVAIHLSSLAGRIVGEHRRPLHRRLGEADRLPDSRVVHEVAEVLAQDLVRLAGVGQPLVVHRRDDADDRDLRVEVLAHHLERVLELDEPAQREVLGLDRHDHPGCRDERVDRQQAERRRSVDQDVVVAAADGLERFLQRTLAPDL